MRDLNYLITFDSNYPLIKKKQTTSLTKRKFKKTGYVRFAYCFWRNTSF